MNEAIIKSRESGYEPKEVTLPEAWNYQIFLDKDFWQALQKGIDGEKDNRFITTEPIDEKLAGRVDYFIVPEWRYNMHRFTDHLIAGKSIDSFFNELLSTNN